MKIDPIAVRVIILPLVFSLIVAGIAALLIATAYEDGLRDGYRVCQEPPQ